jgi:hypothetical protein
MSTYNLEEAQQAVAEPLAPSRPALLPVAAPLAEHRFHLFSIPPHPRPSFPTITPLVSSISLGSFKAVEATTMERELVGASVEVPGSAAGGSLADQLGDFSPTT